MSAHVEVISSDAKRAKIKVTPGTYLIDVLNEACQKLRLNSDNYLLKHKQKPVDLTNPFRTSGLVSGAKLDLVRKSSSPSVVSLRLDVDGRRLDKKLPSDMTLWQVMRQFESADNTINLTARASPKTSSGTDSGSGQLYHQRPIVNIMGKEYQTLEDLQKTLSQCGINSGTMLLRVSHQNTDQSLFDAMNQIDGYLNEVKPDQHGGANQGTSKEAPVAPVVPAVQAMENTESQDAPAKSAVPEVKEQEQEKPVPETTEPPAPEDAPTGPNTAGDPMEVDQPTTTTTDGHLQPTGIFSAPTSSTPAATLVHEDDAVYEPTIAHAQLRQHHLTARAQNTRLKSDQELAADAALEAEKLAKITKVEVKVRFPDQTSVQWEVHPDTTGTTLYQAIRDVMARPDQPFKLVMSVTKAAIHDDDRRLIADYWLKGRELLNLVWGDAATDDARKAAFLKGSVASKAQAVVVPEVPRFVEEAAPGPSTSGKTQGSSQKGGSNMDPDALKKKLGKLFKLPGKK